MKVFMLGNIEVNMPAMISPLGVELLLYMYI